MACFKRSCFEIEHGLRMESFDTVVAPDHIAAARKAIEENNSLSYEVIQKSLGILAPKAHIILHDHL